MWPAQKILEVLDRCCDAYTFPMLDNGYVYLAATRLSLHRSDVDWAMVIEVFGFSPRSGLPDVAVYMFGSRLANRDRESDYVCREAFDNYLRNNPHNQTRFVSPIAEGAWQDEDDLTVLAADAEEIIVRGRSVPIPSASAFAEYGIALEESPQIQTFELCRWLAATHRDDVLATPEERRHGVPADVPEILRLDEWHHPDVVDDDVRPSGNETFQQLARVLATGNLTHLDPSEEPNTHWSNWPDGGSL